MRKVHSIYRRWKQRLKKTQETRVNKVKDGRMGRGEGMQKENITNLKLWHVIAPFSFSSFSQKINYQIGSMVQGHHPEFMTFILATL